MARQGSGRTRQLITAEQLLQMRQRDDGRWYELDRGKLVLREPCRLRHARTGMRLAVRLYNHVHAHKLGCAFGADLGCVLERSPDTVRAPDVAFISASRVPGGEEEEKFFEGSPDLAVEVVSPSNRMPALLRKADAYIQAGTRLVWIIRPRERAVIIRRADGSSQMLAETDVLDGEDVVPGFQCPVAELFASFT